MVKKERENAFYNNYIQHLPQVPVDAPLERGRVYHAVMHHDAWCGIYKGKACNCNPIITRHVEPETLITGGKWKMTFVKAKGRGMVNLDHLVTLYPTSDTAAGFFANGDKIELAGFGIEFATARIVPASPGFEVLQPLHEGDKIAGICRYPVIAWALRADETPHPICAGLVPCHPISDEQGLKYPDGRIEARDSDGDVTYPSAAAWLKELGCTTEVLKKINPSTTAQDKQDMLNAIRDGVSRAMPFSDQIMSAITNGIKESRK